MNGALEEPFRHNSWANRQLLKVCGELTQDQLAASGVGAYGSIYSTLNHIVLTEGRYARRLAGAGPDWADPHLGIDDDVDLAELERRLTQLEEMWDRVLAHDIDSEQVLVIDRGATEVRAGVFVAQALHHGNAHREQICSILTGLGVDPPDLQAWEYAWATGRIWEKKPK